MEDQSTAKLRAVLVFCITMLKSQATQISELCELVAVLTGTVRNLDPTFDDIWNQKKAELSESF